MVGQEIKAIIEVIESGGNDGSFVLTAKDLYDSDMPPNSNTESSSNQQFPAIDLTEVQLSY